MNPILSLIEYHGSVIPKISEADVTWKTCTHTHACSLCYRVYHPVSSDELSVILCYYCNKLRYVVTKSNTSPVSEVRDYVSKYFNDRSDLIVKAQRTLGIMIITNRVNGSNLDILTIKKCYICAQGKPYGCMLMFPEPQLIGICDECFATAREYNIELRLSFERVLLYVNEITIHVDIINHIKSVIRGLIISTLKI